MNCGNLVQRIIMIKRRILNNKSEVLWAEVILDDWEGHRGVLFWRGEYIQKVPDENRYYLMCFIARGAAGFEKMVHGIPSTIFSKKRGSTLLWINTSLHNIGRVRCWSVGFSKVGRVRTRATWPCGGPVASGYTHVYCYVITNVFIIWLISLVSYHVSTKIIFYLLWNYQFQVSALQTKTNTLHAVFFRCD